MVGYRAKMNRRLQRSKIKRIQGEKTGGVGVLRWNVDAFGTKTPPVPYGI
jgi:hypothetical protein